MVNSEPLCPTDTSESPQTPPNCSPEGRMRKLHLCKAPSFHALSISKQPAAVWEWEAPKAGRISLWNYPGACLKFPAWGRRAPELSHGAQASLQLPLTLSSTWGVQEGAVSSSWPERSLCSPVPATTIPIALSWAAGRSPMLPADQAESERRTGASHAAEQLLSPPAAPVSCLTQESTAEIQPCHGLMDTGGSWIPPSLNVSLGVFLYRRSTVRSWNYLGWKGP